MAHFIVHAYGFLLLSTASASALSTNDSDTDTRRQDFVSLDFSHAISGSHAELMMPDYLHKMMAQKVNDAQKWFDVTKQTIEVHARQASLDVEAARHYFMVATSSLQTMLNTRNLRVRNRWQQLEVASRHKKLGMCCCIIGGHDQAPKCSWEALSRTFSPAISGIWRCSSGLHEYLDAVRERAEGFTRLHSSVEGSNYRFVDQYLEQCVASPDWQAQFSNEAHFGLARTMVGLQDEPLDYEAAGRSGMTPWVRPDLRPVFVQPRPRPHRLLVVVSKPSAPKSMTGPDNAGFVVTTKSPASPVQLQQPGHIHVTLKIKKKCPEDAPGPGDVQVTITNSTGKQTQSTGSFVKEPDKDGSGSGAEAFNKSTSDATNPGAAIVEN